jgi:hypothetical protein
LNDPRPLVWMGACLALASILDTDTTAEQTCSVCGRPGHNRVEFSSRKFGTSRSLVIWPPPLAACFQDVACGICFALPLISVGGVGGNAMTTYDIENREIGATEIHDFYAKRAYGGRRGRGAEEAL